MLQWSGMSVVSEREKREGSVKLRRSEMSVEEEGIDKKQISPVGATCQ